MRLDSHSVRQSTSTGLPGGHRFERAGEIERRLDRLPAFARAAPDAARCGRASRRRRPGRWRGRCHGPAPARRPASRHARSCPSARRRGRASASRQARRPAQPALGREARARTTPTSAPSTTQKTRLVTVTATTNWWCRSGRDRRLVARRLRRADDVRRDDQRHADQRRAAASARTRSAPARPPWRATVAIHQTCRATRSAAGMAGSSGGRPRPGASVNTAKPARPQTRPWRQPAMPPANSDTATSTSAKPIAGHDVGQRRVGEALEAVGGRPGLLVMVVRLGGGCGVAMASAGGGMVMLPARRRSRRFPPAGSAARWRRLCMAVMHDAGQQARRAPRRTRRCERAVMVKAFVSGRGTPSNGDSRAPALWAASTWREADEADDEEAEQRGERRAAGARDVRGCAERCEVVVVHVPSFRPPPEGLRVKRRRRQVSWLAGRSALPAFPEIAPVAVRERLAAHSCGGSRGFGRWSSPHSLFGSHRKPTTPRL